MGQLTKVDFLVLNSVGINMFVEMVEALVADGTFADGTHYGCMKGLQQQIAQYDATRRALALNPVSKPICIEPKTLPLWELMDRRTCRGDKLAAVSKNVVYILRDGDAVLYVGSTRYDARSRLKAHEHAHSPLGRALREKSDKRNWTVEMIPYPDYPTAAEKEKEMIWTLRPSYCRK